MKRIIAIACLLWTVAATAQKTAKFGEHSYTIYPTELERNMKEGTLSAGEYTRTYISVKADSLLVTTEKYGTDNKVKGLNISAFDLTRAKIMGPALQASNNNLYEVTVTNNKVAGVASGYMVLKTGYKSDYTGYITAYLYFKDEAAAKKFITSITR